MRYSRSYFPAAAFNINGVWAEIPGSAITRFFDSGPVLALGSAELHNDTGVTNFAYVRIMMDGADLGRAYGGSWEATTHDQRIPAFAFVDITEGEHTFSLWAVLGGAGPATVAQDTGQLAILQLGQWDNAFNINP